MTLDLRLCRSVQNGKRSYAVVVRIFTRQFQAVLIPAFESVTEPDCTKPDRLSQWKGSLSRGKAVDVVLDDTDSHLCDDLSLTTAKEEKLESLSIQT